MNSVSSRRQILFASYVAVWVVLLGALVTQGVRGLWTDLRSARIKWPRASYSSDAFFGALLEAPDGAERCAEAFRRLRPDRSILFLCPKKDARWDFVYGLISSLSWPRDIRKENIDAVELLDRAQSLDRSAYSAIVICGHRPPPTLTRGWWIGRQLVIIPLEVEK